MGDHDGPMREIGTIDADDELSDSEDASQGDCASDTTSVGSNALSYKFESERRYHAFREGAYFLPNDKREQDRMELQHRIYLRLLDGKLYRAPLRRSPNRVLDLGTGTGCWAIDFANQHRASQVIGNDLSPIQPKWIPPNCTFEVDDIESDWPPNYRHPRFDYIHGRDIAGSIADYEKLFAQAYKSINPGAYLELQNFELDFFSVDGMKERAVTAVQWQKLLSQASRKFGKELLVEAGWKEKLKAAGFRNVVVEELKVPLRPGSKDPKLRELGTLQKQHMDEVVESYSTALFTRVLDWSKEELDLLLMSVKNDFASHGARLYGKIWFVYGQKPTGPQLINEGKQPDTATAA